MGAAAAPIAIAGVGTGLQVFGMISAAEAAAEAKRQELALKNLQADEIDARSAINEQLIRERGQLSIAHIQTLAEGHGNVGVGFKLDALHNLQVAIDLAHRDAAFKSMMLRAGGNIEGQLIGDQLTAAYIGAGATVLTGAARGYGLHEAYAKSPAKAPAADLKDYQFNSAGPQGDFGANPFGGYA